MIRVGKIAQFSQSLVICAVLIFCSIVNFQYVALHHLKGVTVLCWKNTSLRHHYYESSWLLIRMHVIFFFLFSAALMRNTGMLVANDINKDRVKALVGNFHRLGVTNSVITSENAKKFPKVWQYTPGQRTVTACSTAEQNAIFLIISVIEQNWNIIIIWYNFEGISCIQFFYICIGQLYHCCCLVHRKIKRKIPLLDIRFLQTYIVGLSSSHWYCSPYYR